MGNKVASVTDLETLLGCVSKDVHQLKDSNINQSDKMNYGAVERLCSPHIQQLLIDHVPGKYPLEISYILDNAYDCSHHIIGSEGTALYHVYGYFQLLG